MNIVAAAASIFLMLAGAASAAPGDIRYASPGKLVAAEGTRLNLYCMGSGSPAVVFDSGWEDWAPVWAIVQAQVARWTQACSYDRAGAGFSDPGPMPRTSVRIADELHSALRNAGIKGPYVLVGHAFGGDNVRAFGRVTGPILPGSCWWRRMSAASMSTGEIHHSSLGCATAATQSPRAEHCPRFLRARADRHAPALSNSSAACRSQCGHRSSTPNYWKLRRPSSRCTTRSYPKWSRCPRTRPTSSSTAIRSARPVRVLSTGYHGIHTLDPTRTLTAEQQTYQQEVAEAQAKWLALSSNARQLFTDQSSEYLPFDQPDFVVETIREVCTQSRSR